MDITMDANTLEAIKMIGMFLFFAFIVFCVTRRQ